MSFSLHRVVNLYVCMYKVSILGVFEYFYHCITLLVFSCLFCFWFLIKVKLVVHVSGRQRLEAWHCVRWAARWFLHRDRVQESWGVVSDTVVLLNTIRTTDSAIPYGCQNCGRAQVEPEGCELEVGFYYEVRATTTKIWTKCIQLPDPKYGISKSVHIKRVNKQKNTKCDLKKCVRVYADKSMYVCMYVCMHVLCVQFIREWMCTWWQTRKTQDKTDTWDKTDGHRHERQFTPSRQHGPEGRLRRKSRKDDNLREAKLRRRRAWKRKHEQRRKSTNTQLEGYVDKINTLWLWPWRDDGKTQRSLMITVTESRAHGH